MTEDEFRQIGHEIVDLIADYRARVAERPVMARRARATSRRGCRPLRPTARSRSTRFFATSTT